MFEDHAYLIYVRGQGFLTESGNWSDDIVDAELFTEELVKKEACKYYEDKPAILKWC